MEVDIKINYNNLDQKDKETVNLFLTKRLNKLFRLGQKQVVASQLYLDCHWNLKLKLYQFDALYNWQGRKIYAKAESEEINNALAEIAKRLRKGIKKIAGKN